MPRCCKGARTPILLAAAIIALVAGRQGALADESGTSFWLLGTYATQAAVPSDPGLSIDMTYYSAGASAGRSASFTRGGRIEVGLDTASNYILLTPTYTFEPKVLGGQPRSASPRCGATTPRPCRRPWSGRQAAAYPARSAIR